MKREGITRFKFHLTHNNTKKCLRVPPEVKEEIRLMVHDKNKAKVKKVVDILEICAQLRETMGTHDSHLIDKNDDDEEAEDEDVYMYTTYMHPNEQDAYQSVVRASKASEWEPQQYENIVKNKRKTGKSSRSTGTPTMMQKSQIMQHSNQSPLVAPSLYKSSIARQKKYQRYIEGWFN